MQAGFTGFPCWFSLGFQNHVRIQHPFLRFLFPLRFAYKVPKAVVTLVPY